MNLELNDRDLAALLFTWQNRYVSTAQLRRAFWQDQRASTAAGRLIALRKEGWLGFRAYPWLSERLLYYASRKGNQALADCGLLPKDWVGDVPKRPGELSPALRHDLCVVDLRLGLEESGADGRTWVSDHQLRKGRAQEGPNSRVPDGLFDFEFGGAAGLGVLEYEHASYRRDMAVAMLARVRDIYGERHLFVVTKTAKRADIFMAWAADSGVYRDAPGRIAFSHQEAVAKDGLDGGFVDLLGRAWGMGKADF